MEFKAHNLHEKVQRWTLKKFGESFIFREGQLETIVDILETFFKAEKNVYLLEAPTGSGKSIIAMIVAGFLNDYSLKGYILASDLSLFDQYVKSFEPFSSFGFIKGADNYTCSVNNEKFSLGDCRIRNVSYEDASSLICYDSCEYFQNRKRAIASQTTLLTYAMWLIQMNYVAPKLNAQNKTAPFQKRDFIICDEAHKVSEIVQNHFSPTFLPETVEKIESFLTFISRKSIVKTKITSNELEQILQKMQKTDDEKRLYILLKQAELFFLSCSSLGDIIKKTVSELFGKEKKISKEWRFALSLSDWIKDLHCKLEDYNHIISQVGTEYIIKNPQGKDTLIFNCLEESYMMNRHFHDKSGFKLFMTATMGDPVAFMKNIGVEKCVYRRMESTFDFSNSPIYYYPRNRMSYSQKEKNFPWLVSKIEEILLQHSGEKGIIHSGSYDTSSKVFNAINLDLKKRLIVYSNSKEKTTAITNFEESTQGVLMGSTLLEGLDLIDEKSRFQIFLKVPYPNLSDKFVQAKFKYQEEWYSWKTSILILQGVGRSVRSEKDFAVTYFLDGCLSDLFKKVRNAFPMDFQKRIITMS